MKKFTAGLGAALLFTLMMLGFAGAAQAADYGDGGTDNSGTTPSSVSDSNAGGTEGNGLLPSTGGPETALLVGGVALVAAGGAAVVVTRRRRSS